MDILIRVALVVIPILGMLVGLHYLDHQERQEDKQDH
jgi:hypothetical protein